MYPTHSHFQTTLAFPYMLNIHVSLRWKRSHVEMLKFLLEINIKWGLFWILDKKICSHVVFQKHTIESCVVEYILIFSSQFISIYPFSITSMGSEVIVLCDIQAWCCDSSLNCAMWMKRNWANISLSSFIEKGVFHLLHHG